MKSLTWLARVGKNNSQTERNPKIGARHILNARFIHAVLISMGFMIIVQTGTTYALHKRTWRALSNQFSSITVPEPLFLVCFSYAEAILNRSPAESLHLGVDSTICSPLRSQMKWPHRTRRFLSRTVHTNLYYQ
jgi:hypothetical protein